MSNKGRRASTKNGRPAGRAGLRGFSLLELLVVIAIIAVLTSYVAPRFLGTVGKSEIQAARAQLIAISLSLEAYRLDMGRYPNQAEGLDALSIAPGRSSRWRGPYLKKVVPLDPWGNEYQYHPPIKANGDYELVSWGADRRPHGDGDGTDLRP